MRDLGVTQRFFEYRATISQYSFIKYSIGERSETIEGDVHKIIDAIKQIPGERVGSVGGENTALRVPRKSVEAALERGLQDLEDGDHVIIRFNKKEQTEDKVEKEQLIMNKWRTNEISPSHIFLKDEQNNSMYIFQGSGKDLVTVIRESLVTNEILIQQLGNIQRKLAQEHFVILDAKPENIIWLNGKLYFIDPDNVLSFISNDLTTWECEAINRTVLNNSFCLLISPETIQRIPFLPCNIQDSNELWALIDKLMTDTSTFKIYLVRVLLLYGPGRPSGCVWNPPIDFLHALKSFALVMPMEFATGIEFSQGVGRPRLRVPYSFITAMAQRPDWIFSLMANAWKMQGTQFQIPSNMNRLGIRMINIMSSWVENHRGDDTAHNRIDYHGAYDA